VKIKLISSIVFFSFFLITFTSCSVKKDLLYLNVPHSSDASKFDWSEVYIQPNDIVSIKITADNPEMAIAYNIMPTQQNVSAQTNSLLLQGYLVTNEGTVNIPILGIQNISGLTLDDAEKQIQNALTSNGYLKNPVVVCRLVNAKVTILGEVRAPGTYTFYENNLTLLQALGLAGDLTINGVRKKITIIRTEKGKQSYGTIDLTKDDWFKSPFYFVKPNDVIIIDPNTAKIKSAGVISNPGNLISLFSVLLSSIIIIKNL
jgi:polysaccharide export outer membrane protein